MNQLLRNITEEIIRLNGVLGNKALSKKDIKEELENYQDFLKVQKKLNVLLKKFKKSSPKNSDDLRENLLALHLLLSDLSWYFDNLHDNVKKIIQSYPLSREFIERNQ